MTIRKKILLYFSSLTIVLVGISLWFIYTLFANYREEEFQKRQLEKITFTLHFFTEIAKGDKELIETIDRITIDHLFDEKLLIFNNKKELIYTSIDVTQIPYSKAILLQLSPENNWIEKKDSLYDVVGVYIKHLDRDYYGIYKAYDAFGYSKLNYLKKVLIASFIVISLIITLISFYLSKIITQSITDIAEKINSYQFEGSFTPIKIKHSNSEVDQLAHQFNILMKRMEDAYAFQKHAVHHISHELKTPVTILVSNFERMEKETDINALKLMISNQKEDTKSLSEIINALLELSKVETDNNLKMTNLRIDEMILDIAAELNQLNPNFQFSISYSDTDDENNLIVSANSRLLKLALTDLMLNCIHYSNDAKAKITFQNRNNSILILFENKGTVIRNNERQYMFKHFFRGENSKGLRGFGLGLVFIHKIITLHHGTVSYSSENENLNLFTIAIPLS